MQYCTTCHSLLKQTLLKDKAIQTYFKKLKNRAKAKGILSEPTAKSSLRAIRKFLEYLQVPITDHAVSDLVAQRKANPSDESLEDKLEEYGNLEPLKVHRIDANRVKGIFKANRVPFKCSIDANFEPEETDPIEEEILRAIYNDIDEEGKIIIQTQAYLGHRIGSMKKALPEDIEHTGTGYSILKVPLQHNKNRIKHIGIMPTAFATGLLKFVQERKRTYLFPKHEKVWRKITDLAEQKYGVRLTSHYLRKRFLTIAEETSMPENHWDYLSGSKKTKGHCADRYNLNFKKKLIAEYHTYLAHTLSLDKTSIPNDNALPSFSEITTTQRHQNNSDIEQAIRPLAEQIQQLQQQIQILTNAIHNQNSKPHYA